MQTWVCSDFWETRTGLATVFLEMPRTGFEEEKESLKTEEKFITWGGETSFRQDDAEQGEGAPTGESTEEKVEEEGWASIWTQSQETFDKIVVLEWGKST